MTLLCWLSLFVVDGGGGLGDVFDLAVRSVYDDCGHEVHALAATPAAAAGAALAARHDVALGC